jgi:hypothetical protein
VLTTKVTKWHKGKKKAFFEIPVFEKRTEVRIKGLRIVDRGLKIGKGNHDPRRARAGGHKVT